MSLREGRKLPMGGLCRRGTKSREGGGRGEGDTAGLNI